VTLAVFLVTAIENGSLLWERYPWEMGRVISRHDALMREQIPAHGGTVLKLTSAGLVARFDGGQPLACALYLQRWAVTENWGAIGDLRICMALHATSPSSVDESEGVERAWRLVQVGWGGQILLTEAATTLCTLPEGAQLRNLGPHLLRDLSRPRAVYALSAPDLPSDFPPLRSLAQFTHNLPALARPFIPREELGELVRLLRTPQTRLITLMGPGGIGKTRLALQAAAEVVDAFADGVYFVPLAAVGSPDLVIPALAAALKCTFSGEADLESQCLDYLEQKQLLLVLDTFEHLLTLLPFLQGLLACATDIKLLITSRSGLEIPEEVRLRLGGLPLPDTDQANDASLETLAAVRLFVQSARWEEPDFRPSAEMLPYIVRICRAVGGNPLGIELAAPWVRALSCRQIAEEIEENLDLLETYTRDLPERHRSLRVMFEYGWEQLADAQRDALTRLAVFPGGFTARAAQEIADVAEPLLAALVGQSWLRMEGVDWYVFQELLREFAAERLAADVALWAALQERYSGYYATLLQQLEADTKGPALLAALDAIDAERDNVLQAWEWAVARGQLGEIRMMLESLYRFYDVRGWYVQADAVFGEAVARLRASSCPVDAELHALLGRLLARQGWFRFRLSQYEGGRAVLEEGLPLLRACDTPDQIAFALNALGYISHSSGDNTVAAAQLKEALKLYRGCGDLWGTARTLNNLGSVLISMGELAEAHIMREESLALFKLVGEPLGLASALNNSGNDARYQGHYAEARALYQQALAGYQELGHRRGVAITLTNLGSIAEAVGSYAEARRLYEEALDIYKETGHHWGVAFNLIDLGTLSCYHQAYGEAEDFYREALNISEGLGNKYGIASAQRGLGDARFGLGAYSVARRHYKMGLRAALQGELSPLSLSLLLRLARIFITEEATTEALTLLYVILATDALLDTDTRANAQTLSLQLEGELDGETIAQARAQARARPWEDWAQELATGR